MKPCTRNVEPLGCTGCKGVFIPHPSERYGSEKCPGCVTPSGYLYEVDLEFLLIDCPEERCRPLDPSPPPQPIVA